MAGTATQFAPTAFSSVRSVFGTNFTDALAAGATENESLAGLTSNQVVIRQITVISKENCDWGAIFYGSSDYSAASDSISSDTAESALSFSLLGATALQVGDLYYVTAAGLELLYQDEGAGRELHMGLFVESGSSNTKSQGTDGWLEVRVFYTKVGGVI